MTPTSRTGCPRGGARPGAVWAVFAGGGGGQLMDWYCLHCHTALTDAAARTHACCPEQWGDGPTGIVRLTSRVMPVGAAWAVEFETW